MVEWFAIIRLLSVVKPRYRRMSVPQTWVVAVTQILV